MKKILVLLTAALLNLEAFDSLIDHKRLGATEITLEKEPQQNIVFDKKNVKKAPKVEFVKQDKVIKKTQPGVATSLKAFISPFELRSMLNYTNTIVLDVDDKDIYKKGHIDGAIHVDILTYITRERNPYKLMKSDSIIKNKIIDLGINKDSNVIIYSHNTKSGILNSSYFALILITFGFENVSILDGGYMAWVFENERLVSAKASHPNSEGNFIPSKNHDMIVDEKYVLDNISKATLIDARESKYYYGTHKSKQVEDFGHISGAKSSYYGDKFLIDGVLRQKNELEDIYLNGLNLNKDDEIIVYADNVFGASMEWYILYKVMGFKRAKIYEASLLEFFDSPDNPRIRFKWE